MKRSETFSEFSKAFAKYQAEIQNPALTATNPHFKSKYCPLPDVIKTVRPILAKHGLSFHQDISSDGDHVVVITTLYHESGEFLESSPLKIPAARGGKPADAQGFGSAASYAKRYQLQAVCGIAAEEDSDAEDLTEHPNQYAPSQPQQPSNAALAAKYQLVMGSREGFEAYRQKLVDQGRDNSYISKALDEALIKKKQQSEAAS
jgi:hypothetical protein